MGAVSNSDECPPLITNAGQSETRSWLNGLSENGVIKLWHDDDRAWVQWLMGLLRLTWRTLVSNHVNVILVFVLVGIVLGVLEDYLAALFVANFFAIVPLAALLSFATEELSAKLRQTIGGLTKPIFGNAVELIVSITALKQGEVRIVQSSMIGSILNILLALGSCFITSGVRHAESRFNETVASSMSSLMAVATTSLIIPATLYASIERGDVDSHNNIMVLSDGTAIIMLITYCIYLLFELESQSYLFDTGLQQEMEVCLGTYTIIALALTRRAKNNADFSPSFPISPAAAPLFSWSGHVILATTLARRAGLQIERNLDPFRRTNHVSARPVHRNRSWQKCTTDGGESTDSNWGNTLPSLQQAAGTKTDDRQSFCPQDRGYSGKSGQWDVPLANPFMPGQITLAPPSSDRSMFRS